MSVLVQHAVLVTLPCFKKLEQLCCHCSDSVEDEEVETRSQTIATHFGHPNTLDIVLGKVLDTDKVLEPVLCSWILS